MLLILFTSVCNKLSLLTTHARIKYAHIYINVNKLCLNKIQTHKSLKRTLFIRTKHNIRIFGVISFIKLQNDTYTRIKRLKTMENELES